MRGTSRRSQKRKTMIQHRGCRHSSSFHPVGSFPDPYEFQRRSCRLANRMLSRRRKMDNLNSCGKFEKFTIVHPCSPYIWASRRQTLPHLHTICLHSKGCKSNESNGAELNHRHATQPSRACASPQMRQVQLLVSVTTNQRPQLVGRAFKHATDVHPTFPLHATWRTSHFHSPKNIKKLRRKSLENSILCQVAYQTTQTSEETVSNQSRCSHRRRTSAPCK